MLHSYERARRGEPPRRRRSRNSAPAGREALLDAAAFQQHVAGQLNLSLAGPRRGRRPRPPPSGTSGTSGASRDDVEQRLTLAQQRGLAAMPPPPDDLTEEQWAAVEQQSEARGDSMEPCSICLEPFAGGAQVLLSCTHVFHAACLQSFERFAKTGKRTCPLCRKESYQKRAIQHGAVMHRRMAAVRLQAAARGMLARRRAARLLSELYAAGGGDPALRRRFFEARVSGVGDAAVRAVEAVDDDLDALFAELDQSVALSRRVFGGEGPRPSSAMPDSVDWGDVRRRADERDVHDCPICIAPLQERGGRARVLLSCSHVFHAPCITAFEEFNIYELLLCPVCRAPYKSLELD